MVVAICSVLLGSTSGWMLSSADLATTPSSTRDESKAKLRTKIENRFYSAPFYERQSLAKRGQASTSGFERQVWLSLAPAYYDPLHSPTKIAIPKGSLTPTNDYDELVVRFLYDCRRVQVKSYNALMHRLLKIDPTDFRLLVAASGSCYSVGSDGPSAALGYAERARAIRPNDPRITKLMLETYFLRFAYRVGNVDENFRQYETWAAKAQKIFETSGCVDAIRDLKRLKNDRNTVAEMMKSQRR